MAHDARTAIAFVDRMEAAARPAFEREIAELQAWARAQGGPDPLAPWDVGFWSERQRRRCTTSTRRRSAPTSASTR
jgi:Zn-dependent oligopeptidase